MTNGEKIEEIFPNVEINPDPYSPSVDIYIGGIMMMRVDRNWWDAEYKEPTTKNDLGVDCIDRAKAQTEIEMNAFRYTLAKERGGTGEVEWNSHLISIDDAVDIIRNLPSVTPQEPCEDVISRKSIKQKLQEHHDFFVNAYGGFSNLPQNDKSRVDEIINCIAMVVNEPPVTPQEPKTGHWIRTYDSIVNAYFWKCDKCKCGFQSEYNFCPNCGAKMVEPQESEDNR